MEIIEDIVKIAAGFDCVITFWFLVGPVLIHFQTVHGLRVKFEIAQKNVHSSQTPDMKRLSGNVRGSSICKALLNSVREIV